jgi:hypothetical protein
MNALFIYSAPPSVSRSVFLAFYQHQRILKDPTKKGKVSLSPTVIVPGRVGPIATDEKVTPAVHHELLSRNTFSFYEDDILPFFSELFFSVNSKPFYSL